VKDIFFPPLSPPFLCGDYDQTPGLGFSGPTQTDVWGRFSLFFWSKKVYRREVSLSPPFFLSFCEIPVEHAMHRSGASPKFFPAPLLFLSFFFFFYSSSFFLRCTRRSSRRSVSIRALGHPFPPPPPLFPPSFRTRLQNFRRSGLGPGRGA